MKLGFQGIPTPPLMCPVQGEPSVNLNVPLSCDFDTDGADSPTCGISERKDSQNIDAFGITRISVAHRPEVIKSADIVFDMSVHSDS